MRALFKAMAEAIFFMFIGVFIISVVIGIGYLISLIPNPIFRFIIPIGLVIFITLTKFFYEINKDKDIPDEKNDVVGI